MAERLSIKDKNPFKGWPMIIAWLAIVIFAGHSITHMVGAGDTWVAMACGRHFINQGFENVTVEPFSANSHKAGPTTESMNEYAKMLREQAELERKMARSEVFARAVPQKGDPVEKGSKLKAAVYEKWADFCESYDSWSDGKKKFAKWIHPTGWVNQNWLTHVIFYWLTHHATGSVDEPFYNALVYWKFVIYLILAVCVYYSARLMGASQIPSAVAACLSVFIGRSFYDVRPAGFSNVLTAVLLLIFVLTLYKNYRYIWLLVPLMIFWSNVHGGFIYVFIVLVPFLGTNFLLSLNKKWRIIFYIAGAFLLFMKEILTVANTKYIPEESQAASLSILLLAAVLILGGFIFTMFKDRFVRLNTKGTIHAFAASFVSFIAVLFLNPFKLTNFTHTMIVSVSEHAKMWRQVHEWHPAFKWDNPVGTSVPFMVALLAMIGFGLVWLTCYIYRARTERTEKINQSGFDLFNTTVRILTAISITWIVFYSFQLTNFDAGGLLVSAVFAIIIILAIDVSKWLIFTVLFLTIFGLLGTKSENAHQGMYIFPFVTIPFYVIFKRLVAKNKTTDPIEFGIVCGTALVSFIAMFIITKNPIGLKTDGFWSTINNFFTMTVPFTPNYYDGGNTDALTKYPSFFGGLILINILAGLIWIFLSAAKPKENVEDQSEPTSDEKTGFTLPQIDLSLLIISALTVFMAIKMRRFITLAGVMMSPFIVLFIEQAIKIFSSIFNRKKLGQFVVSPMPAGMWRLVAYGGTVFVLIFGGFWAYKYNRVYLAPFPNDNQARFSTVFMRMTASNVKPFNACQFIRENELSGNMFNYWTEGGFIAYGQTPDPNDGQTPLKLYMDGRAQAAYDPTAYQDWMRVMSGGPHVNRAKMAGRRPTQTEYKNAGQWIDDKFKQKNVWLTLMPSNQFNSDFMRAIQQLDNWKVVFVNNKQKIMVNVNTPQGEKLYKGLFDGSTKYPDEFSKNVTLANYLLNARNPEFAIKGFESAKQAITNYPSYGSVKLMEYAVRNPALRNQVLQLLEDIDADFRENFDKYKKQRNLRGRLITELASLQLLIAYNKGYDTDENKDFLKALSQKLSEISSSVRW